MIGILITLVIVGVCLYLVNQYIPLAPPIRLVINVIVVLFLIIMLLNFAGIIHYRLPA